MKVLVFIATILLIIEAKLYQVVSLTRHGARYHVNAFGDGNDTKPLWGELTSVGMRQHQRLGQLLRKQYIDNLNFLSPTYNSSEIEVYSTTWNRTLMSIRSQLYGLYPLDTGPRLTLVNRTYHLPPYSNKTDIEQQNYALPEGYQQIKIKTSQKIMLGDYYCPNQNIYIAKNLQLNAVLINQMNETYYPFIQRMAPMFNFSPQNATLYTMLRCFDMVNVDSYLGRPLPQNFNQEDMRNVLHLTNWYYYVYSLSNVTLMFNSGKIQKILSVFDLRTKLPNTYALKWTFLSGHDNDIVALHLGLNLSSPQCIQQLYQKGTTTALNCQNGANYFASSLIFELHSDDAKQFYVKIRSNGKYVNLCGKKSTQCNYTEWKNAAKKNIVANIDALCGKPIKSEQPDTYINQNQYRSPIISQI